MVNLVVRIVAVAAILGVGMVVAIRANDSTAIRLDPWGAVGFYSSGYSASKGESPWYDLSNSAPRGGVGLNILTLGITAESSGLFGSAAVQLGDIPSAGWDADLPWLQEAWVGYHLSELFDVSVGAFISPIGIETVNSFENYSGIMSISYFFDPACHSGAQLTWNAAEDVAVTGGVVSSFSSYQLSAGVPSMLLGMEYTPGEDAHLLQLLMSREESDTGEYHQVYASVSSTANLESTHLLAELNLGYGIPTDGSTPSAMFNGILAAYVDFTPMWQAGLRLEGVHDPSGLFSYTRYASPLPDDVLSAAGLTATIAYMPTEWSKIRLDGRYIGCLDSRSVVEASPPVQERTEIVLCADVQLSFLQRKE
jgi:hypothetical protein